MYNNYVTVSFLPISKMNKGILRLNGMCFIIITTFSKGFYVRCYYRGFDIEERLLWQQRLQK